jgi:signal transduction histidine kinase/DNA-binding response OmpR family regulator
VSVLEQAGGVPPRQPAEQIFPGTSELAGLLRSFDWTSTGLGAPETWPRALKTAIGIMLTSQQPIWIGWGEELIYFYNDPYKSIIGGKHPWALGKPTRQVWREIWGDIGPMLAQARQGSIGTYVKSQLLIMERNGYPEETYYTFSYSPIRDDAGRPAGIFCANTDDTDRVIGERQLKLLRELAAQTAQARSWQQACEQSVAALKTGDRDLPFALLYIVDEDSAGATLMGASSTIGGHSAAPKRLSAGEGPWRFAEVLRAHAPQRIKSSVLADELPRGAWDRPPQEVVVLPIAASGDTGRAGVLVAGLNPYRLYDDKYAGFLDLVAGSIGAAIANAEAYEQERRRADALAEIDRAKTAFFSNVSHEFRTPLTLMLAPLEDVLNKPEGGVRPENRELVEVAHRNGVRLLKLVNTLLDFSRIEAGRVQANYEPVDLGAYTAELASNFRSVIERSGMRLVVDCEKLPLPVYVDRDMWEKVALNLLSNAFKFTFEGEIRVTVRAKGDNAEVIVADTGTGIPPEEVPRLFERFRRVEGARGRSHEGSGIGLALVQELVRLHGGDIRVESKTGEGSAFIVTLPFGTQHLDPARIGAVRAQVSTNVRAQAYIDEAMAWLANEAAADVPAPSAADDLARSVPVVGDEECVLLADDNADMRHYVERLLRAAGYRVDAHPDGASALEAARREPPALVLTDVMMPKLDGFGLLSALRADPGLRDIPVLLLSARAGEEEKVAGLKSGADDYLTKPFSARELIARVQANMELARVRRETKAALRDEAAALAELHKVSLAISSELNLERMVQVVTDAATSLSGASFGAFFYTVIDAKEENLLLYTLSGVPRAAFEKFPMPRTTGVFGPTFRGEGIVRSGDITKDPRYGHNAPFKGMPEAHPPVKSYLAAPVMGRDGSVIGGLFFGHAEPEVFTERAERLVASVAVMAAIAVEKIRLYEAAQREIAQRREVEVLLRENEQTLENRIAERTAELADTNEQLRAEAAEREKVEIALRQAQKMEAIGQLTGGVAHDFNNLLTVIIGNLETLGRQVKQERPDPARLSRSADLAMRGARRAEALTQRLLAFSRQQPLVPKAIDLSRLVVSMSDLLRRTLGEQIEVETVLSGGVWRAFADPNQLEVAILNLAVNARDAMAQGGKLTIETANVYLDERYAADQTEVTPGQYAMIAISDTGTGMPPEVIARAFEPFFTTKDIGHGTGLGLSQVYGFVKQSGGHVRIYSEVGSGTSVKLYLPRLLSDAAADVEETTVASAGGIGSETILVVEDDDDVRAYTTETLRDLGYRVLEAGHGEAGLKVLREHPEIALLFTDVGLPGGMNGRKLSEAAVAQRADLKVLFTSGYTRNAIVHDGRLDAGVELITKPFTQSVLAQKLRDILDAQAGPARILAVEDEALLQMLLTDMLEDAGFKVDIAGSATEALAKLKLIPGGVRAAVVDIGLPDRRGDMLVQELRALHPSLPVVVASGRAAADLKARFSGETRIEVIGKPYSAGDLVAALEAVGVKAVASP